jgi:hypothetical protein
VWKLSRIYTYRFPTALISSRNLVLILVYWDFMLHVSQLLYHTSSAMPGGLELPFDNGHASDYAQQCPLGAGAVTVHKHNLVFGVANLT